MSRALRSWAWLPPNGALHGSALDHLLIWNLGALAALCLLAQALLLYSLLGRRKRLETVAARALTGEGRADPAPARVTPTPTLPPGWLVEWLPLAACTLLFAAMAISSERLWATLRYEGPSPAALQVEVVGVQFQWYFRYPGADARFGQTQPRLVNAAAGNPLGLDPADSSAADDVVSSVLLLPAGHEADLRLRAHDVIHGFFIPGMRLKQNAVPGLVLHVHFTPTVPGDYPILCTQVCGSGHARMQALLRVVPPEQFAAWMAAQERRISRTGQASQ